MNMIIACTIVFLMHAKGPWSLRDRAFLCIIYPLLHISVFGYRDGEPESVGTISFYDHFHAHITRPILQLDISTKELFCESGKKEITSCRGLLFYSQCDARFILSAFFAISAI